MKKIFLILFIIPLAAFGQEGFYLGLQANNGLAWIYNRNDFHDTLLQTVTPNAFRFNNFHLGVNGGYGINEKMSLTFNISNQQFSQDYRLPTGPTQNSELFYNLNSKLKYSYFEGAFRFNMANIYEKSVAPFIQIGVHLSYLKSYIDYATEIDSNDSIVNIIENQKHSGYESNLGGAPYYNEGTNDFIYSRLIVGTNFEFGLQIPISEHLQIGIVTSAMYDLSNTDNLDAKIYLTSSSHNYWQSAFPKISIEGERPKSHNIYAGLGITINYYFRSRYDY
jgi:hypothetical protein